MRISVVIPCFNAEPYLAQTLRSVLNQTLPAAEVIVADNGSNDASLEIARQFEPSVTIVSVSEKGASVARIAGISRASGDAIMFLDADDLIAPDTLLSLSRGLRRNPQSVARCPWYRWIPVPEGWRAAPPSCAPRQSGQDDLEAWLTGWYHPPCSLLWSREAYERSGGWDQRGGPNDDGDLMMRALLAGVRLIAVEGGTGYYRRLPAGEISVSGRRNTREGLESRLFVIDRIAQRIVDAGLLARYRRALLHAYASILPGTEPYPDLYRRCEEAAERHRGIGPARLAFSNIGWVSRVWKAST